MLWNSGWSGHDRPDGQPVTAVQKPSPALKVRRPVRQAIMGDVMARNMTNGPT